MINLVAGTSEGTMVRYLEDRIGSLKLRDSLILY